MSVLSESQIQSKNLGEIQSESLSDCLIENLGESDSLGKSQNYSESQSEYMRFRVSV